MRVLHYQTGKGMLTIDTDGLLTLSIPSNSSISGYERGSNGLTTTEKPATFTFKDADGMLTYKHENKPYSLVVRVADKPELHSEKVYRFVLEPNSVVPPHLTPQRFSNITEASLHLTEVQQDSFASTPQLRNLSTDPAQLLSQLTGKVPQAAPKASSKKCCDVQVTTMDPRKAQVSNTVLSRGPPSMNIDFDRKVKEATERMLAQPVRKQRQLVKQTPQVTVQNFNVGAEFGGQDPFGGQGQQFAQAPTQQFAPQQQFAQAPTQQFAQAPQQQFSQAPSQQQTQLPSQFANGNLAQTLQGLSAAGGNNQAVNDVVAQLAQQISQVGVAQPQPQQRTIADRMGGQQMRPQQQQQQAQARPSSQSQPQAQMRPSTQLRQTQVSLQQVQAPQPQRASQSQHQQRPQQGQQLQRSQARPAAPMVGNNPMAALSAMMGSMPAGGYPGGENLTNEQLTRMADEVLAKVKRVMA